MCFDPHATTFSKAPEAQTRDELNPGETGNAPFETSEFRPKSYFPMRDELCVVKYVSTHCNKTSTVNPAQEMIYRIN